MADASESIRDHVRMTAPEGVVSAYLFGSDLRTWLRRMRRLEAASLAT